MLIVKFKCSLDAVKYIFLNYVSNNSITFVLAYNYVQRIVRKPNYSINESNYTIRNNENMNVFYFYKSTLHSAR